MTNLTNCSIAKPPNLADLVQACEPYFAALGIHPAWIDRWCALTDGDRDNARDKIDNWLGHYLDACQCLRADPVDQDAARDLAARWPPQLLHYANTHNRKEMTDVVS